MLNTNQTQGQWRELVGKVREQWGQLTDDELLETRGDMDQLVGVIQRKTGETEEGIRQTLDEMFEDTCCDTTADRLRETAQHVAENASDMAETVRQSVESGFQAAVEQAKAGYMQSERYIRKRPVETLTACFGAGLLAGVVLGVMFRSK